MGNDPLAQLELEEDNDPQQKEAKAGKAEKRIPVVEIFGPTIQGEGFMAGVRTTFIRFGLCDYRCTMCDSLHAVLPELVKANSTRMTQKEIAAALLEQHRDMGISNSRWVTFSGGNPCIHDLTELVMRIRGFDEIMGKLNIAVETQGTMLPEWLDLCDVITVSPKSPGMGEEFEVGKFVAFLKRFHKHPGFNVKIVIFSMRDIEWAAHINSLCIDWGLADRVYFSLGNPYPPGKDEGLSNDDIKLKLLEEYRILAEDLLQIPHLQNVKFLPQIHVLTWANKQKV